MKYKLKPIEFCKCLCHQKGRNKKLLRHREGDEACCNNFHKQGKFELVSPFHSIKYEK